MATTSTRAIKIGFTGDMDAPDQEYDAASNGASPGQSEYRKLTSGFNSIAVPGAGTTVGVTIVPPVGNTTSITLKGVTGDTGLALHLTDPTSLALAASQTAIGLTVGADITGVRFIWT